MTIEESRLPKSTTRVDFVDKARGLGVIYFIWCHTVNVHMAWVDTWAMPVFFVVMGVFFSPTLTWRELIVKKVNTIIIPFLLLSIPSYIQSAVSLPFREFIFKVVNPFVCVHGVGWFLLCMFWCYMIYYAIIRITKRNKRLMITICLIFSIASFYLSTMRIMGYRIVLPMFISTSLTVLPFVCIGDFSRDLLKKKRSILVDSVVAMTFLSVTLGGGYLVNFRGGEYIENWYYGQCYIAFMAISLLGTGSILFICKLFPSFMSFAGIHSLLLLMIHPYIIRILKLCDIGGVALFVITLIISLALIGFLSYYLPVLEGKKKILK